MSRTKLINELTNLLSIALRHKIGSIVNENEVYSQKYAKDADVLFNQAKNNILGVNFNFYEKKEILEELRIKLKKELESKTFIKNKKFQIMESEMLSILEQLGINSGEN